jgi:hypothetical protein
MSNSAKQKKPGRRSLGLVGGAGVFSLIVMIFLFTLFLGLIAFETSRYQLTVGQVNAICQAAAITGTTMLTSAEIENNDGNSESLARIQETAAAYARNMILKGYVQGQSLGNAVNVDTLSNLGKNLKSGSTQYLVALIDPIHDSTILKAGDKTGTTIRCFIAYGYRPASLSLFGINNATITGTSKLSLPQVDTVLVLDYSAPIDDETVVTFVRREWLHDPLGAGNWAMGPVKKTDRGCGIIEYVSLPCSKLPATIANYLSIPNAAQGDGDPAACQVNALPPQNLSEARLLLSKNASAQHPYFDLYLRSHYPYYDDANRYQRWPGTTLKRSLDYATPPGNCDLAFSAGGNGDGRHDIAGQEIVQGTPPYNAFADTTWHDSTFYGGKPGAKAPEGACSPDAPPAWCGVNPRAVSGNLEQCTFTDLVVNIARPDSAGPSHTACPYPYEQPLRGQGVFQGFSWTFDAQEPDPLLRGHTFDFPNIAVVVEAARGNLEKTALAEMDGRSNYARALLDRPIKVNGAVFQISPNMLQDGYQKAYQRLAMMFCQPIATILRAADENYFQYLHGRTDCHFGFVAFSSKGAIETNPIHTQGTYPDKSAAPPNARSFYSAVPPFSNPQYGNSVFLGIAPSPSSLNNSPIAGGSGCGFRIPRIPLDAQFDHYLDCLSSNSNNTLFGDNSPDANGLYNVRALSARDLGEALRTAQSMFHSNYYRIDKVTCRPEAVRAIIILTVGLPTGGINGEEATTARKVAGSASNNCRSDGIVIYTLGLNRAQNPQVERQQAAFLGDANTGRGPGGDSKTGAGTNSNTQIGLAALAAYGGRFYPLKDASRVASAFKAIAGRLASGQQ